MTLILYAIILALPLVLTGCTSSEAPMPPSVASSLNISNIAEMAFTFTITDATLTPTFNETTQSISGGDSINIPVPPDTSNGYTIMSSNMINGGPFPVSSSAQTNVSFNGTAFS